MTGEADGEQTCGQEMAASAEVPRGWQALMDHVAMQAMRDLPPARHDPHGPDRAGLTGWMRAKIEMQRRFAALLTRHADESAAALTAMEARATP